MTHRIVRFLARSAVCLLVLFLLGALLLPSAPASAAGEVLTMPSVFVAPGAEVVIPVAYAAPNANPVYSFDLTITYDSTRLTLTSATNAGTATASWLSAFNTSTPGTVRIGLATGNAPLTASGQIALLKFTANPGPQITSPLTFTRHEVDEVVVTKQDGSVRINTRPVAVDDSYPATEDTVLTVPAKGVLTNDTDADTGAVLTAVLVSGPASGTLALDANGSFTYTPVPGFNGSVTFTYKANDGFQDSNNVATVTITVDAVNDPPTANAGGPYTVNEGASVALSGSATDVDNTPAQLTYEWDFDNNGSFETPGQTPSFSAAMIDGPATPTIVLRVKDAAGGTATATATVTVNNVPPTANAGGPYFVDEGASITLSGSATDPAPADTFTWAWNLDGTASTIESTEQNPGFSAAAIPGPASRTVSLVVTDDDSSASAADQATVTIRDKVLLELPDRSAKLNAPVQYSVDLSGLNSALTSFNLTVAYPSAILTFSSAEVTGLTSGWTMSTAGSTPGQVVLQLTGSTPLSSPSGAVALLNFTSAASPEGATGVLTISAATVNGGAVSNERAGGNITLLRRFAISGAVTYWKDAKVVPDANLALTSFDPKTDITDASGGFGWAQVYAGSHTLTPSKTGNDNGITAYDAALVLRHSVNLESLSGKALIVADVTGDGSISSADASKILAKSVGAPIDGIFPDTGNIWRFDPPTLVFALAAPLPSQNFTALLMGDPSGSWSAGGDVVAAALDAGAGAMPVRVTVARTSPTTALLTISLITAPADTLGIDLELAFNRAVTVVGTSAVQDVIVGHGVPSGHYLRVGLAAVEPLASGPVATVEVTVPADATLDAELAALTINERPLLMRNYDVFLPAIQR